MQKVTKVHKKSPKGGSKSPKGAPKAPKGAPKAPKRILFGSVFGAAWHSTDFKKMLKTGVEKYDRKCASSIAPATLLEVRGE